MATPIIAASTPQFTRLSDLFSDPDLRRFLRRGESDSGMAVYIPDPDLDFDDGEALELEGTE